MKSQLHGVMKATDWLLLTPEDKDASATENAARSNRLLHGKMWVRITLKLKKMPAQCRHIIQPSAQLCTNIRLSPRLNQIIFWRFLSAHPVSFIFDLLN